MPVDLPGDARLHAALVLAAGLALAGGGHAAWWTGLDTSPAPFLADEDASEKRLVRSTFPDSTPDTVRVVVEAGEGGLLTPDGLTGVASVVDAIATDGQVVPALDRQEGVASVLGPLGEHLEGPPGTWSSADVRRAVERTF